MMHITSLVVVLGLVAAQEGGGAKPAPKAPPSAFAQMDTNQDGLVSKAELLAYFAKVDANRDGSLSRDEFSGGFAEEPPAAPRKKGAEGGKKGGDGEGGRKAAEGEGGKKAGEGDGARKGGEGDPK
jgi:hypothetical protein